MCTYSTAVADLTGSAKGPGSPWFSVTRATAYFDHPVHAMAEHTLNIDLADPSAGPSARVALELTAASARELVAAVQAALDAVPPELTHDVVNVAPPILTDPAARLPIGRTME